MKTISKIFLCLLSVSCALSLHSCTKDGLQMANSISIEVTNIGYTTATVKLTAKTPDNVTGYMVGFRAAEGDPMCDVMEISSDDLASEIFDAKPGKGEYEAEISGLKPGTKYNIRGFIMEGLGTATWGKTHTFTTRIMKYEDTPELVDLGLSVKWRNWNLGASKPEDYGAYYQWAGTTDVTDKSKYLDWSNCPYHTGSNENTGWNKYVPSSKSSYWSGAGSPDNKTVLDPEDDVAHVKLGGKWRMPTIEEWNELQNTGNCSWTWTTINGINGYKVQSKKTGFTDNWIFLPAAGYRYGNFLIGIGSYGSYWYSSLNSDYPHSACNLDFNSNRVNTVIYSRYYGLSVRPVSE